MCKHVWLRGFWEWILLNKHEMYTTWAQMEQGVCWLYLSWRQNSKIALCTGFIYSTYIVNIAKINIIFPPYFSCLFLYVVDINFNPFVAAGADQDGRPVIVFSACRLPHSYLINHQRLLEWVTISTYLYLYCKCIIGIKLLSEKIFHEFDGCISTSKIFSMNFWAGHLS